MNRSASLIAEAGSPKRKTGLVGPVFPCVELDAVTSQHGATGAEAAIWLG